ncbi:uncharacterized protein LY89DRAFT_713319 [Mollisia scopiformis]|uniref:Uncharacterized protein n=1 Tax=Mollisia scopiformis TaxID=149040 RepID=A0A194XVY8_MOLSC|nr:uncharacterized protein LY89DRAFT_713319 [Mollisia scopiformis]KUJ24475.1 hypothetical protein LY89DRAFT_713319 [Mollisia scopiformis]
MSHSSTNTNPLSNPSLALFGYLFDCSLLEGDQHRLQHEYTMSVEERAAVKKHLSETFRAMVDTATEMLQNNCVCTTCGERPLQSGSRHCNLTGEAEELWEELVEKVIAIEGQLYKVDLGHISDLKPMFEGVQAAYNASKVARDCARQNN